MAVIVGQLSLIYDDIGEESILVQSVVVNPDFNLAPLANDIALIEVLL